MREVVLGGAAARGRCATVDDADYEVVSRLHWFLWERARSGRRPNGPYALASIPRTDGTRTTVKMHKLILGCPGEVDHIDGDGLNNQRSNLREVSGSQNGANRRNEITSLSQFKGVSLIRDTGKWRAQVTANRKKRHLGCFIHEEDAARAYDLAAYRIWGEYALLNFPGELGPK